MVAFVANFGGDNDLSRGGFGEKVEENKKF